MGRLKKCRICGESIQKDSPFIPLGKGRGFAHEKCYEIQAKTMLGLKQDKQKKKASEHKRGKKAKPKAELKDSLSEEEYKQKQLYHNYLKQLLGLSKDEGLSPKIHALTEKYIREYGVNFFDLYRTLVYMNEILNKELSGDIVGIIPFYLQKAKDYYQELDNIYKSAKNKKNVESPKTKLIYIKPSKRKIKQIDIASIGSE